MWLSTLILVLRWYMRLYHDTYIRTYQWTFFNQEVKSIGYSPKFIPLLFYCYRIIIGHNYMWTSNSDYIFQPICCEIWPMTTLLTMKSELNCVWQFGLVLKILVIFYPILSLPFHNLESRHRKSSLVPRTRLMPCGIAEQHEGKDLGSWMSAWSRAAYQPGPLTSGLL